MADYSASINWGDGNTSAGTITFDSGTGIFTVSGSNTYAEEGGYSITATEKVLGANFARVFTQIWV